MQKQKKHIFELFNSTSQKILKYALDHLRTGGLLSQEQLDALLGEKERANFLVYSCEERNLRGEETLKLIQMHLQTLLRCLREENYSLEGIDIKTLIQAIKRLSETVELIRPYLDPHRSFDFSEFFHELLYEGARQIPGQKEAINEFILQQFHSDEQFAGTCKERFYEATLKDFC